MQCVQERGQLGRRRHPAGLIECGTRSDRLDQQGAQCGITGDDVGNVRRPSPRPEGVALGPDTRPVGADLQNRGTSVRVGAVVHGGNGAAPDRCAQSDLPAIGQVPQPAGQCITPGRNSRAVSAAQPPVEILVEWRQLRTLFHSRQIARPTSRGPTDLRNRSTVIGHLEKTVFDCPETTADA